MNKLIKTFILGIITLIGLSIFTNSVKANNDLILELISPSWNTVYSGETKTADLKIVNNTGYLLDGEAIFSAWYEGELFQGTLKAISLSFGLTEDSSLWENGTITFSNFEILEGETLTTLKMITNPALIPGQYSFKFTLKGITEEEEHITPSVFPGGGGYFSSETETEEDDTITETDETTTTTDSDIVEDTTTSTDTDIIEDATSTDSVTGDDEPTISEDTDVSEEEFTREDLISTLVFDINLVWKEISISNFLIAIIILCLIALILIIIKAWRRYQKNEENQDQDTKNS